VLFVSVTQFGCGGSTAHDPADAGELPPDGDLAALPARELERMFARLEQGRGQPRRALALAANALRLAQAHARVSGSCGLCERTRSLVEAALAAPPKAAACETGLAYADLLAKRAGDLAGARAAARSLAEHSKRWSDGGACAAEVARWTMLLPTAVDAATAQAETGEPPRVDAAVSVAAPDRLARNVALDQIHVYGTGLHGASRQVRVVLSLDGPAAFRSSELAADGSLPRRAILDLDGVAVAPGAHALLNVGAAGLLRVRAFLLDAATTRVSFDVQPEAAYHAFALSDPYRIVVDFRLRPEASPVWSRQRTIVLDPGHGGAQVGARAANGVTEAAAALSIAVRVRRILSRRLPELRVGLTREANRSLTLEERAAIANALEAELFVSIHLNASPSASDPGGVATYVLDRADDAQARRLAARENAMHEPAAGELQTLLAGPDRAEQLARSLELARLVHEATLRWGRRALPNLADRGVRRAPLYVLAGARMPAVLCEASFVTQPEEAQALAGDEYRDLLAEGIAEGIRAYEASHGHAF
jgi:N-acetylmuramoyl-L-alanine amidase